MNLNERVIALVLSLLCCGLGQIYNRQILKGIDLAIMYLGMIVLAIFSSHLSISDISRSLIIAVVFFLWIIGMIDAYIDGDWFFLKRRLVFIYLAISIFPAVLIVTFSFLKHFYLGSNPVSNDSGDVVMSSISNVAVENGPKKEKSSINIISEISHISEPSKLYIQVAALKDLENVVRLRKRLEKKGYSVVVEPLKLQDQFLHKVIINDIKDEDSAKLIADKLKKEENLNVIIYRR